MTKKPALTSFLGANSSTVTACSSLPFISPDLLAAVHLFLTLKIDAAKEKPGMMLVPLMRVMCVCQCAVRRAPIIAFLCLIAVSYSYGQQTATEHYNLAVDLAAKGDLSGAISEFQAALRLNPNDPAAHNNLGLALYHKGDVSGAIAEYQAASRLNPNLAEPHDNLGILLGTRGDLKEAIAEFQIALRLNP